MDSEDEDTSLRACEMILDNTDTPGEDTEFPIFDWDEAETEDDDAV